MRVRLESIGCRLNSGEVDAMARALANTGHQVVGAGEPADLCILNTCTVTAIAAKKSRQLIRQLRRSLPGASIVATGCDAELTPDRVREAGVDLVVGNRDKDRLLELLAEAGLLHEASGELKGRGLPRPGEGRRTRAFVKIQDGCDNHCSYCVTTVARGPARSLPADELVTRLRRLADGGTREVVLTGVHLGSYGHDRGERRGLHDLVRRLLEETPVPRLRLSSLEPWDLDAGFFELFADPRLQPHVHLPLQSGCDATLRRMARRTTSGEYARLVKAARAQVPGVAVSTDVMVGFPGEDDVEFAESLAFIEAMAFSSLHVFRYSRRPRTAAATMPDQVPGPVARLRSRQAHRLGGELEERFNRGLVGRTVEVLWETAEEHGGVRRWSGLTPNYVRVSAELPADRDLLNRIAATEIEQTVPGGVVGRVVSEERRVGS